MKKMFFRVAVVSFALFTGACAPAAPVSADKAFAPRAEFIGRGEPVALAENVTKDGTCLGVGMFCLKKGKQYACTDLAATVVFELKDDGEMEFPFTGVGHSDNAKLFPTKEYTLVRCK